LTRADQVKIADASRATSDAPDEAPRLRIDLSDTAHASEDRFDRFRLIGWWDQQKLARAKVLVVGAGALGNEIVKNLALLGVGHVLIADMDRIENSNLSRSILYRAADSGAFKAEVAARSAREIYPDMKAHPFIGNVVYDLGVGAFRWADVVIGGLDNREARLAINRNCWRCNRPWIDGAIEQIQGTARVFVPDGPCYECTMSQTDWRLLQARRSCNLLSRQQMENGHTPTTPTISSIIAGVQSQEALKLLHGLETIRGRGFVFDGLSTEAYQIEFQRKADCYSHEILEQIIPLDASALTSTAADLLGEARKRLGPDVELELARDILHKLVCPGCGREETMFASLGRVPESAASCTCDPNVRREPVTFHTIRGDEPFLHQPLATIGVPLFDVLIARAGDRAIGLELSADASRVLGPLVDSEALEWH
jgi:molybdopterin/thiamine biosynthesis adenylyltransferase